MIDFFLNAYKNASTTQIVLELIAFVFGILSVQFAKKENVLVYPTGLIATKIPKAVIRKRIKDKKNISEVKNNRNKPD
jgi:nicotinamide riboside transporter PnuC